MTTISARLPKPGRRGIQTELGGSMIDWGLACMRKRSESSEPKETPDCLCDACDGPRIRLPEKNGFVPSSVRSLTYERSFIIPVTAFPLPPGFSLRRVHGPEEVGTLTALHRAAFGTENMTVEYRLAMMDAP